MDSEQKCPICAGQTATSQRYPHHLCRACVDRITDAAGQPVKVGNTSPRGTGVAAFYDGGIAAELEETRFGLIVYCDGIRCTATEAYMGGIVIQPAQAAEARPA